MKSFLCQTTTELPGDQLFERAPIGLAVLSDNTVFIRVNSAFCRFLGYSNQELLGKTVRDVTYPDDWATSAKLIRKFSSTRKPPKPFEKRYRHKNGQAVWGEVSMFVISDGSHKALCTMAQVVNITKRKKMEEELRLSNERFHVALAGSPTTVFIQDRELRYTWAYNPVSSVKLEDFLGKTDSDIFNPHEAKTLMRIKRKVMKTGVGHRAEVDLHSFDDEKVFDARYEPLRDGSGKIVGIICAAIDITERKRNEQALRESYEQLHAVFRASPTGIFILRADTRHIIDANYAFLKTCGYSIKEAIGHTSADLGLFVNPKDRMRLMALLRKKGRLNEVEVLFRRKTGEILTVLLNAIPLEVGGKACVLGTLMDITKRKQLEKALAKAYDSLEQKVKDRTLRLRQLTEELTRAEHDERRRIADILHEQLQQHLCGMKFRASHLKEGSSTPAMIDSADRMVKELDDAILLTRTLTTDLHPTVLNHLGVQDVIEWLATDVKKKMGLSVTVRTDKRVPMISRELKMFVFEAARELLLNVVKHAKVKTAELRLGSMAKGMVRIQVKDTGVGFNPKQSNEDGSHFGLFRIKERAESLGGCFEVVSQPKKGTSISIILPRTAARP